MDRLPLARAVMLALALAGSMVAPVAHAAITLGSLNVPDRVTVATTWNTVTIPAGADYLIVRPVTVTGYWTVGCTDSAALGADYATLTADTTYHIAVHHLDRNGSFCIAGSGAGTVEITPMVKGR